ncbi:MAG: thiamine phosphate synthase, partial [Planctomycetota bacterium]|nr:thiamine phosphate synthase [Planctomycetota bacterium]
MGQLPPSVVAVSPGTLGPGAAPSFLRALSAAVEAGLGGLLLREPGLEDGPLLELARECRRVLREGWLALSDRVHLVPACEADAVHLGHRSLDAELARPLLGGRTLGVSDHEEPRREDLALADYATLSPFAAVPGKGPALGADRFGALVRERGAPTWALGGLGPDEVRSARAAGARGVFVLRGMDWDAEPRRAVERLRSAWGDG